MRIPSQLVRRLLLSSAALCFSMQAGTTVLTIQVSDPNDAPIPGVVLSTKLSSTTSAATDVAGKTQIVLQQQLQPGDQVPLVLVRAPSPNLIMFAPWEGRATVPRLFNIEVVLAAPGNLKALNNKHVVESLASAVVSNAKGQQSAMSQKDLAVSLQSVARKAGVDPSALDQSFRKLAEENAHSERRWPAVASYQSTLPLSRWNDLKDVIKREDPI
jgi:hypothetical protein